MTKSQRIEYASAAVLALSLVVSQLRPDWTRMHEIASVMFIGGVSWAYYVRTPEDRERGRQNSWLVPATALALAAQWVFFAAPDERLRYSLLGAGLVVAATAFAWLQRKAAP